VKEEKIYYYLINHLRPSAEEIIMPRLTVKDVNAKVESLEDKIDLLLNALNPSEKTTKVEKRTDKDISEDIKNKVKLAQKKAQEVGEMGVITNVRNDGVTKVWLVGMERYRKAVKNDRQTQIALITEGGKRVQFSDGFKHLAA